MFICERIVHLDLKGAPLKIPYLEQVLRLAKQWGATGFLLEWEDTFPYSDELADLGSLKNSGGDGMYSMAEVQHIFQFARDNGLVAIQLVQTIGHMEFVLKHPAFRGLRELPSSPAVLCPTKEGARKLVLKMIDQALNAQPDAKYFHIGADEVWHKGECPDCRQKCALNRWHADALFLEHIQILTSYIKKKRPGITILMWDDMLRLIDETTLRVYDLHSIQPVYWNYNNFQHFQTDVQLWEKYIRLFPKIWAGSAYKGANGSSQMLSPVGRYVGNHDAWVREYNIYKDKIQFAGIILTGWSRYDHYATLCELMPVMLPSLASCLRLISHPETVVRNELIREVLPSQEWPGEEVARTVHCFVVLQDKCTNLLNGDHVATWLNPWQVERQYTVCIHVQTIAYSARILQQELKQLYDEMATSLSAVTGRRSTEEWLKSNITPILTKMTNLYNQADSAMTRDAAVKALEF